MSKVSNYNQVTKEIEKQFGRSSILGIPRHFLTLVNNDHLAALFLSQCLYWSDKSSRNDGFFYKSAKDWFDETALTRHQIDRILELDGIKLLIEVKLWRVNGAPTKHYKLNVVLLLKLLTLLAQAEAQEALADIPDLYESGKSDLPESDISDLLVSYKSICPKLANVNINIDYIKDYTEITNANALAIQPPTEQPPDQPSKKNGNGHSGGKVREGGKKVDNAAPVSGFEVFRHEIRPLAEAFVEAAGKAYYPTNGDVSLWYKVLREWASRGFGPDDIWAAVAKLRRDNLTIGGPQSLTLTMKSLAGNRTYQAEQTPIYHRSE